MSEEVTGMSEETQQAQERTTTRSLFEEMNVRKMAQTQRDGLREKERKAVDTGVWLTEEEGKEADRLDGEIKRVDDLFQEKFGSSERGLYNRTFGDLTPADSSTADSMDQHYQLVALKDGLVELSKSYYSGEADEDKIGGWYDHAQISVTGLGKAVNMNKQSFMKEFKRGGETESGGDIDIQVGVGGEDDILITKEEPEGTSAQETPMEPEVTVIHADATEETSKPVPPRRERGRREFEPGSREAREEQSRRFSIDLSRAVNKGISWKNADGEEDQKSAKERWIEYWSNPEIEAVWQGESKSRMWRSRQEKAVEVIKQVKVNEDFDQEILRLVDESSRLVANSCRVRLLKEENDPIGRDDQVRGKLLTSVDTFRDRFTALRIISGKEDELPQHHRDLITITRHLDHLAAEIYTAELPKRRRELQKELDNVMERRGKILEKISEEGLELKMPEIPEKKEEELRERMVAQEVIRVRYKDGEEEHYFAWLEDDSGSFRVHQEVVNADGEKVEDVNFGAFIQTVNTRDEGMNWIGTKIPAQIETEAKLSDKVGSVESGYQLKRDDQGKKWVLAKKEEETGKEGQTKTPVLTPVPGPRVPDSGLGEEEAHFPKIYRTPEEKEATEMVQRFENRRRKKSGLSPLPAEVDGEQAEAVEREILPASELKPEGFTGKVVFYRFIKAHKLAEGDKPEETNYYLLWYGDDRRLRLQLTDEEGKPKVVDGKPVKPILHLRGSELSEAQAREQADGFGNVFEEKGYEINELSLYKEETEVEEVPKPLPQPKAAPIKDFRAEMDEAAAVEILGWSSNSGDEEIIEAATQYPDVAERLGWLPKDIEELRQKIAASQPTERRPESVGRKVELKPGTVDRSIVVPSEKIRPEDVRSGAIFYELVHAVGKGGTVDNYTLFWWDGRALRHEVVDEKGKSLFPKLGPDKDEVDSLDKARAKIDKIIRGAYRSFKVDRNVPIELGEEVESATIPVKERKTLLMSPTYTPAAEVAAGVVPDRGIVYFEYIETMTTSGLRLLDVLGWDENGDVFSCEVDKFGRQTGPRLLKGNVEVDKAEKNIPKVQKLFNATVRFREEDLGYVVKRNYTPEPIPAEVISEEPPQGRVPTVAKPGPEFRHASEKPVLEKVAEVPAPASGPVSAEKVEARVSVPEKEGELRSGMIDHFAYRIPFPRTRGGQQEEYKLMWVDGRRCYVQSVGPDGEKMGDFPAAWSLFESRDVALDYLDSSRNVCRYGIGRFQTGQFEYDSGEQRFRFKKEETGELSLPDQVARGIRERGRFSRELGKEELEGIMSGVISDLVQGSEKVRASVSNMSIVVRDSKGVVESVVNVESPFQATITLHCALGNTTSKDLIQLDDLVIQEEAKGIKNKALLIATNIKGRAGKALRDPNKALKGALEKQLEGKGVEVSKVDLHFNSNSLNAIVRGRAN